jgi:hypothetical protein
MTTRLFTFGCSFTDYPWPSWADLTSVAFDYYENWGCRGVGNRAIAERIAEAHAKHNFCQDDTIIVQWSSHLRHDWYHAHLFPSGRPRGWKTSGSIFSSRNADAFTQEWVDLFFYEPAYVMHTLHNIILTQGFLKSLNVQWYMTSIGDIRKLGTDIDITQKYGECLKSTSKEISIDQLHPQLKSHTRSIWTDHADHWLEPIHSFTKSCQEHTWWFSESNGSKWQETHPSTLQYSLWIKKNLADRISLLPDHLDKIDKITSTVEKIKTEEVNSELFDFCKALTTTDLYYINWPNTLKGFKDEL